MLVQRMPGKYENRRVKFGLTEDDRVVVTEGVFPGDQVVVIGNALLAALLGNEHKARVGEDQVGGNRRSGTSGRWSDLPGSRHD